MKNKQVIIGIDVSKAKLDVFIHSHAYYFVVNNDPTGFSVLLETICRVTNSKKADLFFCFENTGKYSKMLSVFLHTQEITFVMSPALEIKKSLGITRGKNDKVDARRIALYAFEKKERLEPTVLPGEKIERMKMLLSLREKLVKHRTAYKNGTTDLYDCYKAGETSMIKQIQLRLISTINTEIAIIEEEIYSIIVSDPSMNKNFKLIVSVKGIGKIIAFYFIALTANFTFFVNARSFACYAGIAPFDYSSGTMVGKSRVHHYANKQLKSLLNMAAMSVIQIRGEFQQYFNKRVNELGMNRMSTLNIIRNKLVYRVFAVVTRGTPYVDLYRFVA
jgi:transposase